MCASTVNMSAQHEDNVTLSCNMNSSSSMAWYRLTSEKMILLLSATKGNIGKKVILDHNEDSSHFQLEVDSVCESVSLVIVGLRESDLGLYYCAARIRGMMHFGTAVRLMFTDVEEVGFADASDSVGCSTLLICAYIACGFCGILCTCVLCHRRGCSPACCCNCMKGNTNLKATPVQYASLKFVRQSRAAVPAPVDVTYTTVANFTP
ncbi:uncharacterized protein LOC127650241 isoform X3 [Xyrauchen texanus]|nr:uncharacterized protein LOC127650241 isoform X3 [Xyrauchen texanus]